MLSEFELVVPTSLNEALAVLGDSANGINVQAICGGTNLIVDMRARRESPDKLVSLSNLSEFRYMSFENGRVEIGGGSTINDILYSDRMQKLAPSLHSSAVVFGGQMVRNTATVAGNICSGSPAADTVPPLLTLDAELTLTSVSGSRVVPLKDFYVGFKQDVRESDELVTGISWDTLPDNSSNLFYKLGLRKGDAITVTGVAVALVVEDGICRKARIALNSVAPIVKRATLAEDFLENQTLTDDLIDQAAAQVPNQISPIDDIRASADYRTHMAVVLTRRLLKKAWQQIQA